MPLELEAWRAMAACEGDLQKSFIAMIGLLAARLEFRSAQLVRFAADGVDVLTSTGGREVSRRLHNRASEPLLAWVAKEDVREVAAGDVPHDLAAAITTRGVVAALRAHSRVTGAVLVDGIRARTRAREHVKDLVAPLAHVLSLVSLRAQTPRSPAVPGPNGGTTGRPRDRLVIGADGDLSAVVERVAQVAPTDLPVLLLGETGSGKEVIAGAVHDASPRASRPFLRVNCGAIPSELLDSELFGHERGSFTGAAALRLGWFERADGGTLFLDEIGELPLQAQVRLLRVLQDGSFERVGGQTALRADVRVVAATHRNLISMVSDGRFRQDLWFRISAFHIDIPSLRNRQADIAALAAHFAERAARRFGLRHVTPSAEDIATLRAYSWPGNVRELAAVIDRAVLLGRGSALDLDVALGTPAIRNPTQLPRPPAGAEALLGVSIPPRNTRVTLDASKTARIERALTDARGRVDGPFGAAVRLEMSPHTLRSWMRKLEIDWRRFR